MTVQVRIVKYQGGTSPTVTEIRTFPTLKKARKFTKEWNAYEQAAFEYEVAELLDAEGEVENG